MTGEPKAKDDVQKRADQSQSVRKKLRKDKRGVISCPYKNNNATSVSN